MHAEVLKLKQIWIWGRSVERALECSRDLTRSLAMIAPGAEIRIAGSPREVAQRSRLIVTTTSSRQALLAVDDVQAGSHICAVGADSAGKQELGPEILRQAALLLVDSRRQCEKPSTTVAARALGPSSDTSADKVSGPRELLITTS